jgi:hypothetical protein
VDSLIIYDASWCTISLKWRAPEYEECEEGKEYSGFDELAAIPGLPRIPCTPTSLGCVDPMEALRHE